MAKKMNQHQRIADYMKKHGSITQREASQKLGICYLTTRISEMRSSGIEITDSWYEEKNAFGDISRFKRYSLRS